MKKIRIIAAVSGESAPEWIDRILSAAVDEAYPQAEKDFKAIGKERDDQE